MPPPIDRTDRNGSSRQERLAVNLKDLDRVVPVIRQIVAKDLDPSPIMTDGENVDEVAVAFSCDLLKAAAICDNLRNSDRVVGDRPTRVYIRRREAWTKVPGDRILTALTEDKRLMLSREVFNVEVEAVKPVPKPAAKFRFGR